MFGAGDWPRVIVQFNDAQRIGNRMKREDTSKCKSFDGITDGIGENMVLQGGECEESTRLRHGSFILLAGSALCGRALRVPRGGRLCARQKSHEHVLHFLSRR